MNPSSKKAVSGKRVATTFTGAAACAFAFVPPALAGTPHQPAVQPGQQTRQARADIHKMRTASSWGSIRLSGSKSSKATISNSTCRGANQSHWVHLVGFPYFTCFGFKGTWDIPPNYFYVSKECGGNNDGYLITRSNQKISFEQGTTYRAIGHSIKSVHISNWSGTDKCQLHP